VKAIDSENKIVPIKSRRDPDKHEEESIEREWLRHTIHMQRTLASFICRALAFSLAATIGIFYLQGFHYLDFHLPDSLMHWMGAVTLGEIASLSAMVYGAFFKQPPTRIKNRDGPVA
jgi:hypothetical protein